MAVLERMFAPPILELVAGAFLYVIFPAAGTRVLFPREFPLNPPALSSVGIDQTPVESDPRNCIPSLHTAWGIALWWTCPKKRWLRAGLFVYLIFMFLYTLASGHYLIDMITAIPFTLAFYAFLRGSEPHLRRGAAVAMGMFVTWLILLRYATPVFLVSPVIPWSLSIATLIACQILRRRLQTSPQPMEAVRFQRSAFN